MTSTLTIYQLYVSDKMITMLWNMDYGPVDILDSHCLQFFSIQSDITHK